MKPIIFSTPWHYSPPGVQSFSSYKRNTDISLRRFERRLSVRSKALRRKIVNGCICGDFETTDADEIVLLFKLRGPIMCANPQDIVDQGIMSYEDVRMHADVTKPAAPVKQVPPKPKKKEAPEIPDFSLMGMDAIAKWANEQGLYVARTRRKDDFVKAVLAAHTKKES